MKISSSIVFIVLVALIALSSYCFAEEVAMGAADSPNMQMNDQKDIARIEVSFPIIDFKQIVPSLL